MAPVATEAPPSKITIRPEGTCVGINQNIATALTGARIIHAKENGGNSEGAKYIYDQHYPPPPIHTFLASRQDISA